MMDKPKCKLLGEDDNVFNLIGKANKTLKRAGLEAEAKEISRKVFASGSYDEALSIIGSYIEIV
jgi:hypothetical protein